jgi:membrane fusion protein, adhesin transport system
MLNISENSISEHISLADFKVSALLRESRVKRLSLTLILGLILVAVCSLFLPWTQNIQAKGYVTTRLPEQRPQEVQSVISGRLEKWYVKEGDFVKAGDTLVFISEIKSEYFDPNLLGRTADQVSAKSQSIASYEDKVRALDGQYVALAAGMRLKLEQTRNKIEQARNKISIDSVDLIAYKTNLEIAENQFTRTKELYSKGLKSLTELQAKELKVQEARAKMTVQENKLINSKNELINWKIEISSIEREYADKLAKSQSDKQSALSDKLNAMANTSKLENELSNYSLRQQFYHILAPQSGYITKTLKKGIGEIVKEGTSIATIMPSVYDLAIEIYIRPQDLPLLQLGDDARLQFDGWPAFIISGWPKASTGFFDGEITAIDQFISDNGYYRLLISPNPKSRAWPKQLHVGTGSKAFLMLRDVPIWYELWRQLNGFPPNFYEDKEKEEDEVKLKAPLKSVK